MQHFSLSVHEKASCTAFSSRDTEATKVVGKNNLKENERPSYSRWQMKANKDNVKNPETYWQATSPDHRVTKALPIGHLELQ